MIILANHWTLSVPVESTVLQHKVAFEIRFIVPRYVASFQCDHVSLCPMVRQDYSWLGSSSWVTAMWRLGRAWMQAAPATRALSKRSFTTGDYRHTRYRLVKQQRG